MGTTVLLVVGLGWYTNFRIYRRDVEDMKRDLKTHVDGLLNSLRSELLIEARKTGENAVRQSLRDIKKIQYKLLESEAEKWKREQVFENALSVNSEMLGLAIDNQQEFWTQEVLDSILSTLRAEKLPLLDTSGTTELIRLLNKLSKEYSTEVDSIRELLKTKRSQ